MKTVLQGGCLCGAVRYECDGEPIDTSYCHCDDCRKATGGPYTVGVLVRAAELRVSGDVKGYTSIADSGRQITREFCPRCGSPLFTRAEKYPHFAMIKAGSLDESDFLKPSCQTWTQCALPWAYIDETLSSYPQGSPPRTDTLKEGTEE